jgi:DNA repair exonuclease SbcCD nuclease subunit
MRVAIITDQHFGARKNSKLFHDYFLSFYNDVFFPTLEKEGITTVIDMGDTFDSRKGIDFSALAWAKDNYYDRLKLLGCKVYTVVGNHTAYYKNTNQVNAVDLLLREYENVQVISEAEHIKIDKQNILFIPWINSENEKSTYDTIKKSKSKLAMGHLELNGFAAYRGHTMTTGHDWEIFNKFTKVFSGHYHTRSDNGKIYYLGNPYEIYSNDYNDPRGFHIFDLETLELQSINNPYRMFYSIVYEDTDYQMFDVRPYENKIVKLIVRKKTDAKKFDKFADKLYAANIADLKIVENFAIQENFEIDEMESEDTISILNRYVEESDINLDKNIIQKLIQGVYKEACELV